ncbi:MAG: KR domain-containing protein, partial [Moorea sp. SIO3G5]|nr:KR domain-containing protein [Moorena sp. SIO3G5]
GTWILHQLTKNIELDFFVCCSSVGSIWGSQEQVHDHAINHFLDTFSYYRRSLGLPGLTINWGNIGAEAMGVAPSYVESLERIGLEELQLEQALSAFDVLLNSNAVQTLIARVNWGIFKQVYQGQKSRQLLTEIESQSEEVEELLPKDNLLEQLKTVSNSERENILLAYLQGKVAKLVGLTTSQLDVQQPLIMMGVDSLMASELRSIFQKEIEVDLPIEKLMEGLSITQMVSFLNEQFLLQQISVQSNSYEDNLIEDEDMEEITL